VPAAPTFLKGVHMGRAAFFDVDGTLTAGVGIFRFLRSYLAWSGHPREAYEGHLAHLRALREAGHPREATNRVHYEFYKGFDAEAVAEGARCWLAAEGEAIFNPAVLDAAAAHRDADEAVVLVSGSFPALLAPIAERCGAAHLLCSVPVIEDGVYTGALAGPPMIGEAKAEAMRRLAAQHDWDLGASTAYGDHVSDLPMLRAAGTAVVVGAELAAVAHREGWRRLPDVPEPPPLPLQSASVSQ
jgi:HAD superfamily hydrolase (TIGR01490 family)